VINFPVIEATFDVDDGQCANAILDIAKGELRPLRDEAGMCARFVGVSSDGQFAVLATGRSTLISFVDLSSGEIATPDTTSLVEISAELGEENLFVTAPNFGPLVWTTDNRIFLLLTPEVMVSWQLTGVP
jgi:hypothetical protein